jgi:hypothetical protein
VGRVFSPVAKFLRRYGSDFVKVVGNTGGEGSALSGHWPTVE